MKIVLTKSVQYAHGGRFVVTYEADKDAREVPEDFGQWALDNGFGHLPKAPEKQEATGQGETLAKPKKAPAKKARAKKE